MFARAVQPVLRSIVRRNVVSRGQQSAYHAPSDVKPTTMNDLPIPQGSWQDRYNSNQTKYNLHLLMGIGFLSFSLVVAKASGLFFFNFKRPELKKEE